MEHWDTMQYTYPLARERMDPGDLWGVVAMFVDSVLGEGFHIPKVESKVDWSGRVRLSDFALWATQYQAPIRTIPRISDGG